MSRWIRPMAWLALVGAAGCNILGPDKEKDVGTFLTLTGNASSPPTAFFVGNVTLDGAGCYRLAEAAAPTVIWPRGAYAEKDGSVIVVREATGRPAGEVPGHFDTVGHRTSDLLAHPISAESRELATRTCPGTYYVIADIVRMP